MDTLHKGAFRTGQIGVAIDWLEKCGVPSAPLLDAMAGDVQSIDLLSRDLLARAREYQAAKARRERARLSKAASRKAPTVSGQSRTLIRDDGHLPRTTVGFLISQMIDACMRAGVPPPAGLAELVRVHHEADTYAARELKAPDAFDKAAQYRLAYPKASHAEIARHAGVSRPRVSQWIENGLDRAVERLSRLTGVAELIRSTSPPPRTPRM